MIAWHHGSAAGRCKMQSLVSWYVADKAETEGCAGQYWGRRLDCVRIVNSVFNELPIEGQLIVLFVFTML